MKKIGIIGYGNMGSAIAEGIKKAYHVLVFDKDKKKIRGLSGIHVSRNVKELAGNSDVVILAVKPQDFDTVLGEIESTVDDKLITSIAAGIPTKHIEKKLGKVRVVRVMPNLPAQIGMGMSCIAKGKFADKEDVSFVEQLFKKVGKTSVIKEDLMDEATAISGSGPGFLCDLVEGKSMKEIKLFTEGKFIPVLTSTAGDLGFTSKAAEIITESTAMGTVKLLKVRGLSPEELKKKVASKGGTTEAGLRVLKHSIKNLPASVRAAVTRARELAKKE